MDTVVQKDYLLTIAIPTYNGQKTIRNMMDRLLPQIDERVEVIVSDNCSTDATHEILMDYKQQYPFIRLTKTDKNIGADSNFLRCMCMAKGKYTLLLSDDDIFIEDVLKHLIAFLQEAPDMGLVFLTTGNFRGGYKSKEDCRLPERVAHHNICTSDKKIFMEYAQYYWGFISSMVINTQRFRALHDVEQYKGTSWLQCYIYILCASGEETKLGIFGELCIGAGVYMNITFLDIAKTDGLNYRNMLDFAIEKGFDKQQLERWYIQRLCLLASHGIIKEKAYGNNVIDRKMLFACTRKYVKAWLKIYPCYLVPKFVCRMAVGFHRKRNGAEFKMKMQRSGDVLSDE